MSKFVQMSEEEWIEKFKPIKAEPDRTNFEFDTHGDWDRMLEHRAKNVYCIWTMLDGEGSDLYIVQGTHRVNRMAYFVTEIPGEKDVEYEIQC